MVGSVILNPETGLPEVSSIGPAERGNGASFADALMTAMSDASRAETTAEEAALRFANGDPNVGLHETVIAAEKASIALHFAVGLKNRAIEAYRELMNTAV